MKKIEALVKSFKLDEVREAITAPGLADGVTLIPEVKGFAPSIPPLYRGQQHVPDFSKLVKFELAVVDEIHQRVVEALMQSARTGRSGDGCIWTLPVEEAYRIRTGESGPAVVHDEATTETPMLDARASMVQLTAIIKPFKFDEVRERLNDAGIFHFAVSDVKGLGGEDTRIELYRGAGFVVDNMPKTKLEVVVPATVRDQVIKIMTQAARTGRIGDGKITAEPVLDFVHIRDGASGPEALGNRIVFPATAT